MSEKVGKMMTVDKVRELNGTGWFYKILKAPNMDQIYPGIENECLKGSIDHHVHSYPDFVHRGQDMIQVAIDGAKGGMRALAFKDHYNVSAGHAYLTQRYIDHMVETGELENGIEVYGGMGFNYGMNPKAVRVNLKYPNFKILWFPTFDSAGHLRYKGENTDGGVWMTDKNNNLTKETVEIMEIAVEHKLGIGLGHTDFNELLPLAKKAKELGCRCVVDHPLLELNKLNYEEIDALAELGVYIGVYCQPMIPSLYEPVADPFETVEVIKRVGAERCLIGSDFGQVLHVNTVDGIRIFIRALLAFGITPEEIDIMFKKNPAHLMYLDD